MNKGRALKSVREKTNRLQIRVKHGRKRLKRISRTTTFGGIFLSFLKIGLTGFGGGLAVIAQIRQLAVINRKWMTEHEFAEAFALAQSLPGTNAGNAVTYIGLRLRGWRGAAVAMSAFILPSMVMMICLAILYRHFRTLPNTDRLFHGLNAAVVALIFVTAWRLGRNALNKPWQWYVCGLSAFAIIFLHATIIEVVLVSGLLGIYVDSFGEKRIQRWRRIRRIAARRRERLKELERKNFIGGYLTRAMADERVRLAALKEKAKGKREEEKLKREKNETAIKDKAEEISSNKKLLSINFFVAAMPVLAKVGLLATLSIIFLRMGAATFGGGFVMIPLIEAEVVNQHQWLTHQEFADATALGQITPGPVLITATFIGYRVAGTLGALVSTISVFLPSFLMTVAAGSSLRRFRSNKQVQAFLRGVTPAVVGLLISAGWSVGRAGIHTWIGLTLAVLAAFVLLKFRPNAFWVIIGAGTARFLLGFLFS